MPAPEGFNEYKYEIGVWKTMEQDRQTWMSHWQDLNDCILPRRLRYLQTEDNDGSKKHDKIINNEATRSSRVLGAGKMAGETSPARPWFRYAPGTNPTAEEVDWVADTERKVRKAFDRSNLYTKIHEMWLNQGVFGTAVIYIEEDEEDDVRAYVFPLGQYCLGSSGKGRIDTVRRRFRMTVEEIVTEFGKENVTPNTLEKWNKQLYYEKIDIQHTIKPNRNRDTGKIDNQNMPYVALWAEINAPSDWNKFLRKSGYEECPFFVARWNVIGEDVYGSDCPGMDCLGDNKGMQVLERRKAEAVDKIVRPPLKAPIGAKIQSLSLLPGDVSYVDENQGGTKVEPIIKVESEAVAVAKDTINEHEGRIAESFYVHLFLAMLLRPEQKGKQPVTAAEVAEISDERMLMLGPVVTRDTDDVLDPMHNRIVRILARRGKLLPVPESMKGKEVKIEYVSVMAQAQKLLGTAGIERFTSFVGSLSAVQSGVKHIPNWRRIVRNYAEMLGVAPDEVNVDEVIDALEQAEAQAQQQQAAVDQMKTGAEAAKAAAGAELGGDSMLSRLLAGSGMSGASASYAQ